VQRFLKRFRLWELYCNCFLHVTGPLTFRIDQGQPVHIFIFVLYCICFFPILIVSLLCVYVFKCVYCLLYCLLFTCFYLILCVRLTRFLIKGHLRVSIAFTDNLSATRHCVVHSCTSRAPENADAIFCRRPNGNREMPTIIQQDNLFH